MQSTASLPAPPSPDAAMNEREFAEVIRLLQKEEFVFILPLEIYGCCAMVGNLQLAFTTSGQPGTIYQNHSADLQHDHRCSRKTVASLSLETPLWF